MDIWKKYLYEKTLTGNKKKDQININNKYIKNHSNSYDEIRNHVLETAESKENAFGMVLGNLPKKYKYKCLTKYFS
jgi:hypothetical protein